MTSYTIGRQLVWLDDDFDMYGVARDEFLRVRRDAGVATDLVRVDPHTGITEAHLAAVRACLGGEVTEHPEAVF